MDKSILVEEWRIRSQHRPILSEVEHDALVSWLGDTEGEHLVTILILKISPEDRFVRLFFSLGSLRLVVLRCTREPDVNQAYTGTATVLN